jgi:predicted acylesterase/phospholipase RssA
LAVAGRRTDGPEETEARFPRAQADIVKAGVKRILTTHEIGVVVASAGCGADILALEAAIELKRDIRIVLPNDRAQFRVSSVVDDGGDWAARYDALFTYERHHVIVIDPTANPDDAVYARANRGIVDAAREFALKANVRPRALAIWEAQPAPTADATKEFIDQAQVAGLNLMYLSTLPVKAARAYLEGVGVEQEPEDVLDLRDDLARSEPALANQLARELARRFLQNKTRMQDRVVDRLWKACKEVEAFGFARRILKRRLDSSGQITDKDYKGAPGEVTLRQQRALCTSKDPDLSAAMRHDWALEILRPNDPATERNPEHQGIAGGIYKRRWEWDGARASLEQSLEHYRKGISDAVLADGPSANPLKPADFSTAGYVEINYAFVLDLLACLGADDKTNERYKADASAMRQKLIGALSESDQWSRATLTEAYVGLGDLAKAAELMGRFMEGQPASWEVETTVRQLVRLAYLRGGSPSMGPVLAPAFGPATSHQAALNSLLIGRVGLALSGGGFRASLYHLGVLARLAESDVLRHVEVLSCVSGGSIVGALYYLRLREQLVEKGEALQRQNYVAIVKGVIEEFVAGVQRNVRTQVLAKFGNAYALVSGDDRQYARCVGQLFHETFYAKVDPGGSRLDQLLVQPKGAPHDFNPARHNWKLKNKVPILVLNAATLNTGHSWQFTARSMGESPFSLQPEVDSNPRLRRPNYHPQISGRSVFLRDAVAASACVPGLFAPLQLDDLYGNYKVRLVDGGVFDNQGSSSLIEQDCQVMLVSDAAGQLFSDTTAADGHLSPLLRSVSVFQERIRQSGYDSLIKRKQAGQIRGLAYTHLTQGLQRPAVDWLKCEDPLQPGDQLPDDAGVRAGTGDGVDKEIQLYLAKMRTDLDVFSEIESAALMASGYKSMDSQLTKLCRDVQMLKTQRLSEEWFFSPVVPVISGQDNHPEAFSILRQHLSVAYSGFGRYFKLNAGIRILGLALAVLIALVLSVLVYTVRHHTIVTVGSVAVLALGLLLPMVFGNWIGILLDPHSIWRDPLRKYLIAIPLTLFAKIILKWVDPAYLERGRLASLPKRTL